MRELILKALKTAIEKHPEIVDLLEGNAAKIAKDGVEKYQKIPYRGEKPYEDRDEDWDDWEVTQEDIDRAVKRWDEAMPDYKGLLDAKVEIDPNKSVKKDA